LKHANWSLRTLKTCRPCHPRARGARLLITESTAEFDAVRRALEQEIGPRGIIERLYVNDISSIVWEMLRLRRCKTAIINIGFRPALENLLNQLLKWPDGFHSSVRDQAEVCGELVYRSRGEKKSIALLDQFGLEEFAIEAEAIRRSLSELESIERLATRPFAASANIARA
jgi:hypothetical protein